MSPVRTHARDRLILAFGAFSLIKRRFAMIKLYFKALGFVAFHAGRMTLGNPRAQELLRRAAIWQVGISASVAVIWLLWDLLPLVAIGFAAWHFYQWRYRERW